MSSKEELSDFLGKLDWEGGIQGLLDWGGSEAFTVLGPAAVLHAADIEYAIRALEEMIYNAEDELRGYEDE